MHPVVAMIIVLVVGSSALFLLGFAAGMGYQASRLEKAGIIEIINGKMKAKE